MSNPEYAFILPSPPVAEQMKWFQQVTVNMRPDQVQHVWHLAHSWGAQPGMYADQFFRILRRAVKNTLNNLP